MHFGSTVDVLYRLRIEMIITAVSLAMEGVEVALAVLLTSAFARSEQFAPL
jgi:hypothetical protein